MIYLPWVQQFFWSCAHQLSYQRGHHIVDGPQSRVKMTRTIQDGAPPVICWFITPLTYVFCLP